MSFEKNSPIRHQVIDMDVVNRSYKMQEFGNPNTISNTVKMICRREEQIKNIIYTDGNVINVSEFPPIAIDEYYINGKKYDREVNELIKKRAYIKDASYVVKVTLAAEVIDVKSNNRKGRGIFYVIKDIKVFFKDKKDKNAVKKAKETIRKIKRKSSEHTSCWDIFFSCAGTKEESLIYENPFIDIYQLRNRNISR